MKRVIRIVLMVVVVGALAAGGFWLYQTRFAPAGAPTSFTQIVPVREGPLSNSLSVVGELDSTQSQELAFENMDGAAELESLIAATGNTVKQGQTLATIDPTPYQQALDQAQTDLQAAEKKLAELQTPATALEKAQADLAVAKAEYEVQRAKQDLADVQAPDPAELEDAVIQAQDKLTRLEFDEKLAERDGLAKSERDLAYTIDWYQRKINLLKNKAKKNAEEMEELEERQAELPDVQADLARVQAQRSLAIVSKNTERRTYQSELAEAQQALSDARAGGDELDLAKAELAIRQAQVALTEAQEDRLALETGADPTELAAAQADVDKKRLAVSDAEAALAGTELQAPFDGTILETKVRAGNKITANTVIMTIANLDEMQVYAAVDETTIRRIEKGQKAQIRFDAFPGQSFQGTVLDVPLQGTLQNDVMVYQVPLSLEGATELPLLVGMTANVEIQTTQVDNALLVPTMALQRNRGEYMVMVVDPNDPQAEPVPTPVEVGLSDGAFTQIVQGLKAGDQVVVTLQASTNTPGFGAFPGGGVFFSPASGAFPGGGVRRPGGNSGGNSGGTRP